MRRVLDLVVFKVLYQLCEHIRRLVRAEELGVLACSVVELASLQDHLLERWVLRFLNGAFGIKIKVDLVSDFVTAANASLCAPLSLLLFILLSLCLTRLLHPLVTFGELLADLLGSSMVALHPGVANDVSHGKALMCVKLEHACDEILELLGEEARLVALAVHFPEKISPVGRDQFVE